METTSPLLEEVHHRQIDLRFYRRVDGLYEIEGRLTDVKRHAFRRQLSQADTPAGTPLHDLTVRLVIDDKMQVHDASATLAVTPFPLCGGAAASLEALKGQRIGAGWSRLVRDALPRIHACTHIVELLGPMATTAFQGLAPKRLAELDAPANVMQRQAKVDSCYAYAAHREVVAQLWPDLHRPAPPTAL